jgi:hypothetical protein
MAIFNNLVAEIDQVNNNADQTLVIPFNASLHTIVQKIILSYYGSGTVTIKVGISASPSGTSPTFFGTYTDASFNVDTNTVYPLVNSTLAASLVIVTNAPTGEKFNYAISYAELPLTNIIANQLTSVFDSELFPISGTNQTIILYANTSSNPKNIKDIITSTSAGTAAELIKIEISNGTSATAAPLDTIRIDTDITNDSLSTAQVNNFVLQPGQVIQLTALPLTAAVTVSYLISLSDVK